jgi:hypothetical protein
MWPKPIPTEYSGVHFRSRLEADVAYFLDALKIKWKYEPQSFLLKTGRHFMPDFYLTDLKTWLEVKGDWNRAIDQMEDYEAFCLDKNTELVVLSRGRGFFIDKHYSTEFGKPEPFQIGKCSKCNSWYFCGQFGDFRCRKCGYHNGTHDIKIVCKPFDDNLGEGFNSIKNHLSNDLGRTQ